MAKIKRQYSDEYDRSRQLYADTSWAPPAADFCQVCGHWTKKPIVQDGEKQCKPCHSRSNDLKPRS